MIRNYHRNYALAKFRFARRLLLHRFLRQPRICPYCGPISSGVARIRRKKWIMDIVQCGTCGLIFRWPADTASELDKHYEDEFAEESPQARLPDTKDLPALQKENFASLFGPDLNHKMHVLRIVRPTGRVLDFGCSWGYATYLMKKNGYDAVGFEVSKPRADYARKHLGVEVVDSLAALPDGSFDVVYSNHVLEHLPSIGETLACFSRLLTPDGIALHALPNFSGRARRTGEWVNWIGEDHPVAPTIEFFRFALPAAGLRRFRFATTPLDEQALGWVSGRSEEPTQLDGDELLIGAQK